MNALARINNTSCWILHEYVCWQELPCAHLSCKGVRDGWFLAFPPLACSRACYKGFGAEKHEPICPIYHIRCFCLLGTASFCFLWKQNFLIFFCEEPFTQWSTLTQICQLDEPLSRHYDWFIDVYLIHFGSVRVFSKVPLLDPWKRLVSTTENSKHAGCECEATSDGLP